MSRQDKIKKAQDILLNERGVDYIMDCYSTPSFVQCVCSIGGDIITFRVHDDGTVTEK